MKNSLSPLIAALGILSSILMGCSNDNSVVDNNNQIMGSGRIVSELRSATGAHGIHITSVGKVYVTQDTVESVRIEADDNIIGLISSSISAGVLEVKLHDGSYSNVTIRIYATPKNISLLSFTGAGEM